MKRAGVIACLLVAAPLTGCSSEGDILPRKERFTPSVVDSGGGNDSAPDVDNDGGAPRDPNANCVKPGTPSNDRGVGGYCEVGPVDCVYEGGPRFCTADFKEIAVVPDNQWFCSTVCTMDEECGMGALCLTNDFTSGCVPVICRLDAGSSSVTALAGKAPWR
ncbi:MAG TPA: hypothetical protein VK550_28165 [Polyangiaceae bacterium]|nr:hypothetical protein [Polyangiaceae bacterium]